jgi:hypothetical protein
MPQTIYRSSRKRRSVLRSRRNNKKDNKRSYKRKQRGGISKSAYESHKIDVTTFGGQMFTFYTDCITNRIRDIKTALLEEDLFKDANATFETIRLMSDKTGEIDDNEIITKSLSLRVVISSHLIGVFKHVTNTSVKPIVSLPTKREREAYEHAIDGTEDDMYTYQLYNGGPTAYIFFSKQEQAGNDPQPLFLIADEIFGSSESEIKIIRQPIRNLYNNISWYTISLPYLSDNLQPSDTGACQIARSYKDHIGSPQDIAFKGYEYSQVNKLSDNVFTYVSTSKATIGQTKYVVGIPNKDIFTLEESKQKALDKIKPFINPR